MTFHELVILIMEDFSRIDKPTPLNMMKHYFVPRGEVFKALFWVRIVQFFKGKKVLKYTVGVLAYLLMRKYEYKYGVHINSNIRIGGGLHIVHGDGVHLNVRYVGNNVTIYPGVICGSKSLVKSDEIPIINDNVTIYSHSVVVGNISLGKGSIVSANTFVSSDIPPGCIVTGSLAKAINKKF